MFIHTLAAVALLFVADEPGDAVKKEIEALQGKWVADSITNDGNELAADQVKLVERTVEGDKISVTFQGQLVVTATFTVSPTSKPKQTDVTQTNAPNVTGPMLGIYELDGDTYKVCLARAGSERPTDFQSTTGSGRTLIVWKRKSQ